MPTSEEAARFIHWSGYGPRSKNVWYSPCGCGAAAGEACKGGWGSLVYPSSGYTPEVPFSGGNGVHLARLLADMERT